ncbi:universal stress protein UspA [Neosynechococcus sphagnicola sy1]|uniref:Universal stress protein UspA n=1 Tax=Neosynechococcus sphagnicola sy1 TaxID=1497020 RepID=A0A098TTA9_9CYAN|nr:universal stress protein [Neosynechococcus sphagnicola]KGF74018.1 universal stress protein UspA [Neosynechococcus sphagnicola sy1]
MIRKILVSVNHPDEMGHHIFKSALYLAQATGANLKLLHVLAVEESDNSYPLTLRNPPEQKQQWQARKKPDQEFLQAMTTEAIAIGVPTEYSQDLGRPGHIICDTAKAWGADLIVMGRRGLSGMSELLLGSISNYVFHHAPCSVLVVQGFT